MSCSRSREITCSIFFLLSFVKPALDPLTMSSLLEFAVLHFRLLVIMINQEKAASLDTISPSTCLDGGLKSISALSGENRSNLSLSAQVSNLSLFKFFLRMLTAIDTSFIASMLIEILSVMATKQDSSNPDHLNGTIEASWSSLQTVYAYVKDFEFCNGPPQLLCRYHTRIKDNKSRQVFNSTMIRLSQCKERGSSLHHFRLLQHWCLITQSSDYVAKYGHHFSKIIDEIAVFVASLDQVSKKEEEKKETVTRLSLPFLSAATFEKLFVHLLHMLIGTLNVVEPALSNPTEDLGPYIHCHLMVRLFRRLLEVYERHFFVFSARHAADVYYASRLGLQAMLAQIDLSVDWRNNQPLVSWEDKRAGKDPGASKYLQALLNDYFLCLPFTIINLCDFWDRQGSQFLPQATKLRQAAEKAAQSLEKIAIAHNWPPPTTQTASTCNSFKIDVNKSLIDEKVAMTYPMQLDEDSIGSRVDVALSNTDSDDSDDSFGVAGEWGDCNDDSSTQSLQLALNDGVQLAS